MIDHDPNINVYLSEDDAEHCIVIDAYEIRMHLHARSALDLHAKLGKVITTWLRNSFEELLRAKGMIR